MSRIDLSHTPISPSNPPYPQPDKAKTRSLPGSSRLLNLISSIFSSKTKEPEIFHLGGTRVSSFDPNNTQSRMGGSYTFEGVVALKNEQGEIHIYGNKLKKYVLEWMDQCRKGEFQASFQDYFSQKLNEDDEVKAYVEKHKVRYLNPGELKQTETAIVNGELQQIGLDSQDNGIKPLQSGKTPYAFVIMDVVEDEQLKTKLYMTPKTKTDQGKIQHSSFPRGGSVKSSGMITVNKRLDGTLSISVSNRSGHYRPTTQELIILLDHLKSQGYDISTIYIDYVKCRALAEITGFKWGISTQRADLWLEINQKSR